MCHNYYNICMNKNIFDDVINLLKDINIYTQQKDFECFNIKEMLDSSKPNKKLILDKIPKGKGLYFVIYIDFNKTEIDKDCDIYKGKKPTKATASGTSDNLSKSKPEVKNTEVPPKNIAQKNDTTNITKETNKSGDNVTQIIQTPKAKVTTNEIKNNAVSLVQPDVDLTETEENKVVVYNPKNIIKKDFLDFIAVEKKGYEIIAKELNGVLITGKSKEARDEMVNWIIRESGVYNEKVVFDKNKPLESMEQISEKARNAEAIFPVKNIRTIVYVENLDDFLADQSSENRKKIAMWNSFAEHVSEEYHTTILFQSDKPEKLEAASVAPHRVGLEVNLDLEYTEADKKEEEKCNKKLASFEKYASERRS